MEGDSTKLLLVTANVGSIFEDPEHMLKIWLKEFLSAVKTMEPGMVAIHCQEVGGKNYEASMQHVNQFVKAMLGSDELQKYDRARVFLDEDYTAADKFTALGNLYFIHECVEDVMIFDFIECKFMPVEGREVLSGNIENIQIKEKAKYPQNFFPDFKWSRKGFLRTRWSVNNCVFDLINIHLFHDASNLIAMQKSPSIYVENRYRALAHTLQRFETDQFETVPYFLFGDFNFRLDLKSLLKELTVKTQEQATRGKKDQISKLVYNDVANNKVVLTLESKNFDHHDKHSEVFSNKNKLLNQYDIELAAYKDKLLEYDIDFPPSYPFSEDVEDGQSYMKTRCPSWCDRILLSYAARDIVHTDDRHKPKYSIMGKEVCMGDHKPVYLNLLLKKGKGKSPAYEYQSSVERRSMLSKTISINGETMEFESEKFDIHDFAEFERTEYLIPEFRLSLKQREGGGGRLVRQGGTVDEDDGEAGPGGPGGAAHKVPSFQDVARQVCLMETVLLKWPQRPRTRHHSSSSEDLVEEDSASLDPPPGHDGDDTGAQSDHTDVSELSDTEDIHIDLHPDTHTQQPQKDTNDNAPKSETHGHKVLGYDDSAGETTLKQRASLLLHEAEGGSGVEHVHVTSGPPSAGPTVPQQARRGSKAAPLRCPCVVL